jgi:hypothetical protein
MKEEEVQPRVGRWKTVPPVSGAFEVLPGSLHSVAGAPDNGAEENAGYSGRDDTHRIERVSGG